MIFKKMKVDVDSLSIMAVDLGGTKIAAAILPFNRIQVEEEQGEGS